MMPEQKLPHAIDPVRYAKTRRELAGVLTFGEMPRLLTLLSAQKGHATAEMRFFFDESHRLVVALKVQAALPLTCQRCLKPFLYAVDVMTTLSVVKDDAEAEIIPEHYEPLVLTGDECSPLEMVEEELLLSIPLVPLHDDKDCASREDQAYYASESAVSEDRHHPFEVLAQLKK
jgi:uncharacterized protein